MSLSVEAANAGIDAHMSDLSDLNEYIHANPELAYEEVKAHDKFVDVLAKLGFKVTPHAYGVPTSFLAEYGSGGRLVVFNAEYDALPGVGHACGHNLIATSSFASFLGVVAAMRKAGDSFQGRVQLLGTPAEEGGGGKLKLIDAGAYKGVDACLMIHPAPEVKKLPDGRDASHIRSVANLTMLANVKNKIFFTGRESHAAMAPWQGINALDAVVLAYNGVSMLRQQMRPIERIHGVLREGGTRPNVTPAHGALEYYVRSDTRANADALWERVKKCFEGAALATGCTVEYEHINSYSDLRAVPRLCQAYMDAMPKGTVAMNAPTEFSGGSTDMGNVCYECPGFHGAFCIETPPGVGNHTHGFTASAITKEAFDRAVACGRGMAAAGLRVLDDAQFAADVRKDWEADMEVAKITTK